MKHNQNGYSLIGVLTSLLVIGVIIVVGRYVALNQNIATDTNKDGQRSRQTTHQDQVLFEFTGTITAINNGCSVDGTCSVLVDNKRVITGGGLSAAAPDSLSDYGNLGRYGGNTGLSIGQKVAVKAHKYSGGYTLQNCASCYVK